ncbi:LemA family protein [Acetilactobacillus jinshanensis]|uniref:LemA family protein n=1 Tax=Acetilactobacillus jinshanensis TaxID=1720083 RepID=A0A4P6ZLQ7_9LACO|nr:LemA family protein [Acetilactobacillus jinshanensis]QBP18497.1 LemA family protein [Acetilactobacillus jinshanensis]URL61368.1 LemA family protein [uncultured bacterium]
MVIGIIIAIVVIIILAWVLIYNRLVHAQTDTDNAWSQIDVQLQRRNDLIPNLVNTVKGYANYESNTLQKVIKYRGQMVHIDPNSSKSGVTRQQMMNISNQLTGALKSLFAVSERYPDLKANENFKQLMAELTNTENKIAYARQLYNQVIARYNAMIRTFPNNLVAGSKFTKRDYLKAPESAKAVPNVHFGDFKN